MAISGVSVGPHRFARGVDELSHASMAVRRASRQRASTRSLPGWPRSSTWRGSASRWSTRDRCAGSGAGPPGPEAGQLGWRVVAADPLVSVRARHRRVQSHRRVRAIASFGREPHDGGWRAGRRSSPVGLLESMWTPSGRAVMVMTSRSAAPRMRTIRWLIAPDLSCPDESRRDVVMQVVMDLATSSPRRRPASLNPPLSLGFSSWAL